MRVVTLVVMLALVVVPLATHAEHPAKVNRIGLLLGGSITSYAQLIEAFRQGLRDLGHVEGQTISLEYRAVEGRDDLLPARAAELVHLNVDVMVTAYTQATVAAKQVTTTIPIVMVAIADPIGSGLVASLARPGGNITGSSAAMGEEFPGKWVELLRDALPRLPRVAVISERANPSHALYLNGARVAADTLRVALQVVRVAEPEGFERAFAQISQGRSGAIIVLPGPLTIAHRSEIVALAAKSRLPAVYGIREFVEAGGLMSYGVSLAEPWRRAATYVHRILSGANPADLPVEQPTKYELVVNLKTAKALGLTIPQSVLVRADVVIR